MTKDVPPRAVVVGNPARPIRDVPDEELPPVTAYETVRLEDLA